MILVPKNWSTFQHYKDRAPAWIKLHRALLDDFAFSCLPVASRALAPCLWLLASEYSEGKIDATIEELKFRLRMTEKELIDTIQPLVTSGLFQCDSELLAECKHDAIPRRGENKEEVQVRKEEKNYPSLRSGDNSPSDDWPEDYREEFWKQYPRRVGRKAAFTKLANIRKSGEVTFAVLMAGVARIPVNDPKFIPHPSTWLNQGRWDDEVLPLNGAKNETTTAGDRARAFAQRIREVERSEGVGRSPDVFGGDRGSGEAIRPIPQLQKLS